MPPKNKKKKKGGAKQKKKAESKAREKKLKKIVVDKTFGMKNKNKSKKVQRYAEQLENSMRAKSGLARRGEASTAAGRAAQARARKANKKKAEAKERELMAILGPSYIAKNAQSKKLRKKAKAKAAEEKKQAAEARKLADARDFGVPIVGLDKVVQCEGKQEVGRLVCQLMHRDTQLGRMPDGTPLLNIKLHDGSTKYPVTMVIKGDLAKQFGNRGFKVNKVMDVRDSVAMMRAVRGEPRRICVEMLPQTQISIASERLTKHVKDLIQEREEVRARGGIPIEELIEEERMALPSGGTPVTEETFMKWLADRKARKAREAKKKEKEKGASRKGGKLSGRMLFAKNSSVFVDDDSAAGSATYANRVTLSDDEDEDDTGGESKTSSASVPSAPAAAASAAVPAPQAASVHVADPSLYLDGDDDDLDDLEDD